MRETRKTQVLSFGAGVNSTAILALFIKGAIELDLVIFADTGGEHPLTYKYIEETVKPLLERLNLPLVIVQSKLGSLYDHFFLKRLIPTCHFRQCTVKFKIRPLKRYLKARFGKDYTTILGIDSGEKRRVPKKREGFSFPLVERGITRRGCVKLIEKAGLPIPRKSGCFFCPFMSKRNWLDLLREYPHLFDKAQALEENGQKYPSLTLSRKPLYRIRKIIEGQRVLDDWGEEKPMRSCFYCEVTGGVKE